MLKPEIILTQSHSKNELRSWQTNFHPKLCNWFTPVFKHPTAVQVQAWKAISESQDVLISSPTGSGKTLAAFLYVLNTLFCEGG